MEIDNLQENGTVLMHIAGRLDTVTASELDNAVKPYIGKCSAMVFNCEKLQYVSSAGLRVVLSTHKLLAASGGRFVLKNLNPEVKSVFDITGFSKVLVIE
jgi:anti-anti-sigma factor